MNHKRAHQAHRQLSIWSHTRTVQRVPQCHSANRGAVFLLGGMVRSRPLWRRRAPRSPPSRITWRCWRCCVATARAACCPPCPPRTCSSASTRSLPAASSASSHGTVSGPEWPFGHLFHRSRVTPFCSRAETEMRLDCTQAAASTTTTCGRPSCLQTRSWWCIWWLRFSRRPGA
jgi:hypothetical protein